MGEFWLILMDSLPPIILIQIPTHFGCKIILMHILYIAYSFHSNVFLLKESKSFGEEQYASYASLVTPVVWRGKQIMNTFRQNIKNKTRSDKMWEKYRQNELILYIYIVQMDALFITLAVALVFADLF